MAAPSCWRCAKKLSGTNHYPADENNLCNWAMRCLLVQDEDRLILIDNGIGGQARHKIPQTFLPER